MKKLNLSIVLGFILIIAFNAAAQERVALTRFIRSNGSDVYAASPKLKESYKSQKFEEITTVGYIYLTKQPNTSPLFHIVNGNGWHSYVVGEDEFAKATANGWYHDAVEGGRIGYVPTQSADGVKPVTRFWQPNGKINLFAFTNTEVSGLAAKGLENKGIVFYVYSGMTDPVVAKPDLQLGKLLKTEDKSLTFEVFSTGADVNQSIQFEVTAFDFDNKQAWQEKRSLHISTKNGQPTNVTFNLSGEDSLTNKKFKVRINGDGALSESNTQNNVSQLTDGPFLGINGQIKPKVIGKIITTLDLSARPALYFNGSDSTGSPYTSPGGQPLRIKRTQGNCPPRGGNEDCSYNLGFIVMRNDGKDSLSIFSRLSGETFSGIGNNVTLADGETYKGVVVPVKLKMGANKIKVEVDADSKIAEANENNNSFEVTIIIEP